jgi:two-component system sensor kinase FixL
MTSSKPAPEFQALLDVAVDAIIIIDHRGVIEIFNRAAEKLFGYSAGEMIGANVSLLMPEPHATQHGQHLQRYLSTGVPHIIGIGREVDARRKDGSVFPAWLSVGRINGSSPPRFAGFLHDITARRRSDENEKRSAQRFAEVARLSAMADMAADIAHEINQPLAAITNYALACERLLSLPEPNVAELQDALGQIAAQALRAGTSIRRLRNVVGDRKQAIIDERALPETSDQ